MRRIQITHTDLDGYGCEFIAKKVFPDIETHNVDYKQFSEKVIEVSKANPDMLIVSDIWSNDLSKDALDYLTYFKGELLVFDHHPGRSEEEQNDLEIHGATVINGVGESATLKMAKHFCVDLPAVDLINTYDLSGTIEGDAGKLNALFWEYKDQDKIAYLFDIFNRNPFFFNKKDNELYQTLQKRKAEYYKSVVKNSETFSHNGVTCVFVEATHHIAYVSKHLLTFSDLAIMYDKDKSKISYRSVKPLAGKIAKAVGGGGHDQAAGSSLLSRDTIKQKIMELL